MQIKKNEILADQWSKHWRWISDSSFFESSIATFTFFFSCKTFITEEIMLIKINPRAEIIQLLLLQFCFNTRWRFQRKSQNKNDSMSSLTLNSFQIQWGWILNVCERIKCQTRYCHTQRLRFKRPIAWHLLSFNIKMQTQTSNVRTYDTQK